MYGKVFDAIYDGTLYGHWEAIVTMQQMIVLANAEGIVDMTPHAIAARTSIPLDIITKGIEFLEKPDPYSRTPGDEGRRIARLDDHRPWGWRLVNHARYQALRNLEQKREADRRRIADKRLRNKDVAIESQGVANVAYTDTDIDIKNKQKAKSPFSGAFLRFWGAWPKTPRKGSQGECWEKWRKRDYDLIADEIISHVEQLKRSADWQKESGAYVPAPLVYLNKRRWEGADAEPSKKEWHV